MQPPDCTGGIIGTWVSRSEIHVSYKGSTQANRFPNFGQRIFTMKWNEMKEITWWILMQIIPMRKCFNGNERAGICRKKDPGDLDAKLIKELRKAIPVPSLTSMWNLWRYIVNLSKKPLHVALFHRWNQAWCEKRIPGSIMSWKFCMELEECDFSASHLWLLDQGTYEADGVAIPLWWRTVTLFGKILLCLFQEGCWPIWSLIYSHTPISGRRWNKPTCCLESYRGDLDIMESVTVAYKLFEGKFCRNPGADGSHASMAGRK